MRWFGETWGASCYRREHHVATPVGAPCVECRQPITLLDQGVMMPSLDARGNYAGDVAYHRVCFFRHLGLPLTLHILHQGLPVCRFSVEVPARWPTGHIWVRTRNEATCEGCRRIYDEQHAH